MRGGKRPGAGRPAGAKQLKSKLDVAKFQSEMQDHLQTAIIALVDVAENGKSESARVSAATEIINRAVGRSVPVQELGNVVGDFLRVLMDEGKEALEEEGLGHLVNVPLPGLLDE